MHIALWFVQALLALAFTGAGAMKLLTPISELATKGMGGWVTDSPEALIRFIGATEVLGAVGLIVPAATRIAPKLTPAAAVGFVVLLGLGAATHIAYGEYGGALPSVVLGGLAAFVAWGRTQRHPIAPRGT
jgi:putative oxidoreductase